MLTICFAGDRGSAFLSSSRNNEGSVPFSTYSRQHQPQANLNLSEEGCVQYVHRISRPTTQITEPVTVISKTRYFDSQLKPILVQ